MAPGSVLGGSQAGVRLGYRLSGRLSTTARVTSPRRPESAEAALGLEWQPLRRVPVRLVAERRQAIGAHGRSGFALSARGGVSELAAGPLRVDAYGQAGAVGTRSRDLFADGAARVSLPLDGGSRLKLGVGAWAAAQPGAARADVGPQASWRLPVAGGAVTVAADWRFRVAGDARPGSGPALTLSAEF